MNEATKAFYTKKTEAGRTVATSHQQRDLDILADYLLGKHQEMIKEQGMEGKVKCGELPFKWKTDYEFSTWGAWERNQVSEKFKERNLLVVIPGRDHSRAIVMADH